MKSTKRTISLVMAFAMVISTMTVSAQAASSNSDIAGKTIVRGNYRYKVVSLNGKKGTANLVGAKTKKVKFVKIPKTIKVKGYKLTVTGIGNNAFKKYKKLKTVKTNTVLTSIGTNAFANCTKLSKITISSKQLKSVGKNALKGISKKAVIQVPSSSGKAYSELFSSKGQASTVEILTSGGESLNVTAAQSTQQTPAIAASMNVLAASAKPAVLKSAAVTTTAATSSATETTTATPSSTTTTTTTPSVTTTTNTTPSTTISTATTSSTTTTTTAEPSVTTTTTTKQTITTQTTTTPTTTTTTTPQTTTTTTTTTTTKPTTTTTTTTTTKKQTTTTTTTTTKRATTTTTTRATTRPTTTTTTTTTKPKPTTTTTTTTTTTPRTTTTTTTTTPRTTTTTTTTTQPPKHTTHTFGNWYVKRATSCQIFGLEERVCTYCGVKETRQIEALAHKLVSDGEIKATCTERGKEYFHCTVCGQVFFHFTDLALGHRYSDNYTVDVAATCTKAGTKSKHCMNAGCTERIDVTTIPAPATGHNYVFESQTAATCTENGVITKKCTNCGDIKKEYTSKLGHSYEYEYTVDVEATCTTPGEKSRHCTRQGCNARTSITKINNGGHTWGEVNVTKMPTSKDTGTGTQVCEACRTTRNVTIATTEEGLITQNPIEVTWRGYEETEKVVEKFGEVGTIWFAKFKCDTAECEGFDGGNSSVMVSRRAEKDTITKEAPQARAGYVFVGWKVSIEEIGEEKVPIKVYEAKYVSVVESK